MSMATSNDSNNSRGTELLGVLISNSSTCDVNDYNNDDFFDSCTSIHREMVTTTPPGGFSATHDVQRCSNGDFSMAELAGDMVAIQRRYRWRSILTEQLGKEKENKGTFMWSLEAAANRNKVEFG
ncbi:unnamed protein product [Lactuca saligna]|uniref:Uncharacterized protein n=1 Tax=Lactuca saligna TaxID=75948 RepID=A0AA35V8G4_LACSI|nr:unnamed protein product [Lactuca saligna]